MTFNNYNFKMGKTCELYKTQMNGFNDNTLKEYNPMLMSSLFKKEFRDEKQEQEFIESYLESAKIIMEETYDRQSNNLGIAKTFLNYSLVLPTIYLCRHCLELSIKKAIRALGKSEKFNHSLLGQWSAFRQYLKDNGISREEEALLNDMGKFIEAIELLDDNGMKLRYPKQKDNSDSQKGFLWVNTRKIVEQTELFLQQLEDLRL